MSFRLICSSSVIAKAVSIGSKLRHHVDLLEGRVIQVHSSPLPEWANSDNSLTRRLYRYGGLLGPGFVLLSRESGICAFCLHTEVEVNWKKIIWICKFGHRTIQIVPDPYAQRLLNDCYGGVMPGCLADDDVARLVSKYFFRHQEDVRMSRAGFNALNLQNFDYFREESPFPNVNEIITDQERRGRFKMLLSLAKPGDVLFLADTSSVISKMISAVDRGPWSHVVPYVGDKSIVEIDTDKIGLDNIEKYNSSQFRIGLYRMFEKLSEPNWFLHAVKGISREDVVYDYLGALRAGMRSYLDTRRESETSTPNGLIRRGWFSLIHTV